MFKNYPNSEKLDDNLRGCIFLENSLPPLILINSNDNKYAEIFTLLHEFAHYLLDKEELDTNDISDDFDNPIEVWCNEFAYSFLINLDIERKESFNKENVNYLLEPETLKSLSDKYKVSKAALMYRFLIKNIISLDTYKSFKRNYSYKKRSKSSKGRGGNYYYTIRDKLSKNYISLVDRSYRSDTISRLEAFNYLKVKDSSKFEFIQEAIKE